MTSFERVQKIFNNWDKEAFRAAHHEDYMFIREFEMVTLEDHIESVDEDMRNSYDVRKRWTLMHENEYVEEVRWEEGNEVVAHVSLKKDGLLWRGFVNRVKNQSWTDHFSCSSKTVIASVTVVVSVVAWDVIA